MFKNFFVLVGLKESEETKRKYYDSDLAFVPRDLGKLIIVKFDKRKEKEKSDLAV